MEDQIQEKQQYLRQQIIQKNYQPEEFAEYCERTVGNVDLQGWTFSQLRNIVKGFITSKNTEDDKNNFKSQGSSFMKYQQQKVQTSDIDIDQIDVRYQTEEIKKQETKPSMFSKVVNTVDQMFKDPFGVLQKEQKSQDNWIGDMWNSVPSSLVSLNINNFNFGVQQANKTTPKKQSKNDQFDAFGDFSMPSNDSKPQQSVNKPIAKPPITYKPPVLSKPITQLKQTVKSQVTNKVQQNFSIFDLDLGTSPSNNLPNPVESKSIPTMAELAASMTQTLYTSAPKKIVDGDPSSIRLKAKYDGPKLVKQDFFDNIPCIKAKIRNLLSQPSLSVEVVGHQIANRSYLLPNYVLYTIHTKPLNVQVKRKYTYFLKLRQVLAKFYPGIQLPFLQKGAWLSQTSNQLIKSQKQAIQYFLNDILMNKQLRNCRIVQQFLTFKDKDGLRNKFAEYQKMDSLKSIEEMCLLRGSVDVAYTDQHRIYFEKLAPFLQNIQSGIQKYKGLMDKLGTHYCSLIKTYTQIQETFTTIQGNIKTFNSHVNFCECYDLQKSIRSINDYYKQLNNGVRFQAKILQRQFKPFWNYESSNINTIQQLLDIRTKVTDAYTKNYTDNSSRNQTYLNNRKIQQYKQGVSEVSKHPAVLKYQMGFFNQASAQQTMRMFNDLSMKINHRIIWMTAERHQGRNKQLEEFFKIQKRLAVA